MKLEIRTASGAVFLLTAAPVAFAADPAPSGNGSVLGNCVPCANPTLIHVPPDPYLVATLVIVSLTLGGLGGWALASRSAQVRER